MKKLLTLIAFICFWANANAQYVNIPDVNFRNFLIGKYTSCFNSSKQMDTTCTSVVNEWGVNCGNLNIKNIDGIQFFKNLQSLGCDSNNITKITQLPSSLLYFNCSHNQIDSLPHFKFITWIDCSYNKLIQIRIDSFGISPGPMGLDISHNLFTQISNISKSLYYLNCNDNLFTSLLLKDFLYLNVDADNNPINNFEFPQNSNQVSLVNNNLYCLPKIPINLRNLVIDTSKILCLPLQNNNSIYVFDQNRKFIYLPICNPINNKYNCHPFPTIQSYVFLDNNKNGKLDNNELPRKNIKISLLNNYSNYTNQFGISYIYTDSLNNNIITPVSPNYYQSYPPSYTHTFNSYDTLVLDTFALQSTVIKDSLAINLTPLNFAARPGFIYVYEVSFENMGTTVVNPTVTVVLDTSKYIFDSTNNTAINFSGNTLSYSLNSFVPGQTNSFYVYGRVKTTTTLGSILQATASINGGSASAVDTANTTVRGSFDPNDKQATPQLSVAQVADNNHWIDYTIRFENTGTDTAFTVVIADTLDDSKVQINSLQLKSTSHNVKATQNDKIVYFEFLNINLPDSNTNKIACNGFVNFRVKPLTTLVNGYIVPNKASIYFDYNEPIITNTAKTIIGNVLPLSLTALGAIPKPENNTILVYFNTANEINTSYFIIEQSTDARTFKACAEVAAIGKGNNSYYYNIAKNNVQYIRLKMVDKNGTYSYSNIIRIAANDKQETLSIVSPTKGILKINVMAASLDNTKANLVNSKGKVVKIFTLKQGYQTIDIDALPSGLYYVQANDVVRKIIVNR